MTNSLSLPPAVSRWPRRMTGCRCCRPRPAGR